MSPSIALRDYTHLNAAIKQAGGVAMTRAATLRIARIVVDLTNIVVVES